MRIRKKSGTAILDGNVVDGLEERSTTNAPSQSAVAEAINEAKESLKQNIITAYLTTAQTTGAGWGTVALSGSVTAGDKFTLTNNQIVVGAGVTKVKVSGSISTMWDSALAPDGHLGIFKNGAIVVHVSNHKDANNQSTSISAPPFLVDVKEGDSFSLSYYGSNANNKLEGASYYRTYMTVEEVKA